MRKELAINHPKLQVWFESGTEGPQHDPYGYEEIHAVTPLGEVVVHEGLSIWLEHDGKRIEPVSVLGRRLAAITAKNPEKWAWDMFGVLVGYTPTQIRRFAERLHSRCPRCGNTNFESVRGYPGETFQQCSVCHHINGSSMDFSAIE